MGAVPGGTRSVPHAYPALTCRASGCRRFATTAAVSRRLAERPIPIRWL